MGTHPVAVTYDNDNTRELATGPDVLRFIGKFHGHNVQLYCHHRDRQILMVGILLLTLGKLVTGDRFQGWMENIIHSFRGSLGIQEGYYVWTEAQYPDQRCLSATNYILNASFQFRTRVFYTCLCCSKCS
jgi:hypothetical protein